MLIRFYSDVLDFVIVFEVVLKGWGFIVVMDDKVGFLKGIVKLIELVYLLIDVDG